MYGCTLNDFDFACVYVCECWNFSKSQVFDFASNQILFIFCFFILYFLFNFVKLNQFFRRVAKINARKIQINCPWRNPVLFTMKKKKFYLFFIYLFIYVYCLPFFAKLDTSKIKRIWWLAKSNTSDFEKFQHSQRYIHTWKQIRLKHIRTWRTLLLLCLTSSTICKRKICNSSHKFMIKVKRFSASRKPATIMYK